MNNHNSNSTKSTGSAQITPKVEVYTYWHRGRAIVLIPAKTAGDADCVYRKQYGSLGAVQDNVYAEVGR